MYDLNIAHDGQFVCQYSSSNGTECNSVIDSKNPCTNLETSVVLINDGKQEGEYYTLSCYKGHRYIVDSASAKDNKAYLPK